jgi:excisionase family DNA binding protein
MSKQNLNVSTPSVPLAYSIRTFGEATGLSRAYVNKLIATGELKTRKAGRRVLIPYSAAVDWLEANTRNAA